MTPTFLSSPPPTKRPRARGIVFLSILAVLLVFGVAAGVFTFLQHGFPGGGKSTGTTTPVNTSTSTVVTTTGAQGQALFSDSQNNFGVTDSVKITVTGLALPSSGSHYSAWIVNVASEQILPLGKLAADDQATQTSGQSFSLTTTQQGTNLLASGNKLEITQETTGTTLPTGKVVLSGTFPTLAFVHIKHLLVAFPSTPKQIGLLPGLRQQAQLLNQQAQLLQQNSNNRTLIRCIAQNMIFLIEGKKGKNVQPLSQNCAAVNITPLGDGFGLLGDNANGYVTLVASHASLAATQTDSTDLIKQHAGHVEIAMNNLKDWYTTIDQDAQGFQNNPRNATKLAEVVSLANNALNGVDLDDDGTIDPVKGEAGAITAYIHAELMTTLTLTPGA